MSGFQAIVTDSDNRVWDSIRDTQESALFKVSDYMSRTDPGPSRAIRNQLIFGTPAIDVAVDGFNIEFKYIP